MSDLCQLSLEAVAAEIAAKRVSPFEVTRAVLDRIERLEPKFNAYITVTAEQALDASRSTGHEIAAGEYRGPLHGVPVAVKDLFDTKGVRTTAGSKILADNVPDEDAHTVACLHDAGAVPLGKLGMHEIALGATSINQHYGDVHNPWNVDHVPAGSSGGSGAATAAGLAYATLGSDTGGSIRVPAAVCGCVGMMPTYGRASLRGLVPLAWSLDHPGPLTRTVRDAAIVLRAISGHDARDPSSVEVAVPEWLDGIERGPRGLRVGVPRQYFWDSMEPHVEQLVRAAIEALAAAGADVREVDFPQAATYAEDNGVILVTEAAAYHAPTYPSRKDDYSPQVAALLELGLQVPGTRYAQALRTLTEARHGGADAILDGVDVLAIPTTPLPPPAIGEAKERDPSPRMASLTGVFDLTGQPAISVPCALTAENLPVGISFAGRRWDEASVLWAGRAYEQVRGPFPAPPLD
jgi:aspartyl-tRNA(Asn)/glutamyl-tRNA(Gln) amidotransferase subunit A